MIATVTRLFHEGHDHGAHHWAPGLLLMALGMGVVLLLTFGVKAKKERSR